MPNSKAETFIEQVGKIEQNLKDLENKRLKLEESLDKIQEKKTNAIKDGNMQEAHKLQTEEDKLADEIRFMNQTLEIAQKGATEKINNAVLELIQHREARANVHRERLAEIKKELLKAKFEYLKKIKEIYADPFQNMKSEIDELNELIRKYGNSKLVPNPRALNPVELSGYSTYGRSFSFMPYVQPEEVQDISSGRIPAALALFEEFGIIVESSNEATNLLRQKRRERDGKSEGNEK